MGHTCLRDDWRKRNSWLGKHIVYRYVLSVYQSLTQMLIAGLHETKRRISEISVCVWKPKAEGNFKQEGYIK